MTTFLQVPRLIRWASPILKLATGQKLLLRRNRKRIDEALNYEIVNGRLVQTEESLEVQEEAIRRDETALLLVARRALGR